MAKAHPGFANVASGIAAKQGVPIAEANAELAASTRRAGPAARKKNPRLNKVRGKPKGAKSKGPYDYMRRDTDTDGM